MFSLKSTAFDRAQQRKNWRKAGKSSPGTKARKIERQSGTPTKRERRERQ